MATRKKQAGPAPAPQPDKDQGKLQKDIATISEGEYSNIPEIARYQVAKKIAQMLSESRLTPEAYRGRPADCFIAMQLGHELGLNPFNSVQSIAVIDGRPGIYGDALIGIVRKSPLCLWIEEDYDPSTKTATCRTQRKGDPKPIERKFSWDMATMAGLTNKDNYLKYGPRMLQMRARSWCLRDAYPDVMKGLGVVEELRDYSDEPAPITDFNIPAQIGASATGVIETTSLPPANGGTVTYETVVKAFDAAADMSELLKASNLTKHLTNEADIAAARVKYKERKHQIEGTTHG